MGTKIVAGIHLPANDSHFSCHLEKNPIVDGKGTYQHRKIELALEHCTGRGVALDIGAHVGLWSRMLVIGGFEKVVAFEPVPEHIECWNLNMMGYADDAILYKIALGNHAGVVRMKRTDENTGMAHVDDDGEVIADIRRLDDIGLPKVDFIKIDVEGYEAEIVRGGARVIKSDKPFVVVEQKGGEERYGGQRRDALALLQSWGMKIAWEKSGDFGLGWPE